MTRGQDVSHQHTNQHSAENVPDAILTLTKNVLGQNMTKTIEPLIKRVSIVETADEPTDIKASTPALALNPDAKKKRKKNKVKRKQDHAVALQQEKIQQDSSNYLNLLI